MWYMTILLAALSLTGCATTGTDVPIPVAIEGARVPLKSYPREVQMRLAEELQVAPAGSALARAVIDYGQLRRAVCAAEGYKQPACQRLKQ
jgi:hypothetical protein